MGGTPTGAFCISATLLQDVYSPAHGPWTPGREAAYRIMLSKLRAELASGIRSPDLLDFGDGPNKDLWDLDRLRFARLCTYLRLRQPDAVIGYTIFVYRLNAAEVHAAVNGSVRELGDLLEKAWAQAHH
jgi:hypothetical protein